MAGARLKREPEHNRDNTKANVRPIISETKINNIIKRMGVNVGEWPVSVIGIRGFFLNMGNQNKNDRGIYDDAIIIKTPTVTAIFNGNVDPSGYRKGEGFGSGKGMARLAEGAYFAHIIDMHGGSLYHEALCQRVDNVTVIRDGKKGDYRQTGRFGINWHMGGTTGTSSAGCPTVPPSQYNSFLSILKGEIERYKDVMVKKTYKGKKHPVVCTILVEAL